MSDPQQNRSGAVVRIKFADDSVGAGRAATLVDIIFKLEVVSWFEGETTKHLLMRRLIGLDE